VKSVVCENCVIATGGSAVYCDGAMSHLQGMAKVIFLDVPIGEIKHRIGDISQRGVVIKPGMTLDDLYAERRPLYLKYADETVECEGKTSNDLVAALLALAGH
jgi:shikimate kinase